MQKCIVMWKSVLMYKAFINSATSFPSYLTPFLVGIGSDNYHLLLHPSCCMLVDGLHACRWFVMWFSSFTEFELFKLSPQAILADSIKSFYMHNQQSKCTDIVLELEIDLKMLINIQFTFFPNGRCSSLFGVSEGSLQQSWLLLLVGVRSLLI